MLALQLHGYGAKQQPDVAPESNPYMSVTLKFQTGPVQSWASKEGGYVVVPKGTSVYASQHKEAPDGRTIAFYTNEEIRVPLKGKANQRISITVEATSAVPGTFPIRAGQIDSFYGTQPSRIRTVTNPKAPKQPRS